MGKLKPANYLMHSLESFGALGYPKNLYIWNAISAAADNWLFLIKLFLKVLYDSLHKGSLGIQQYCDENLK